MALPSGYKRLEYIRSTGEQYIDTEYFPKWNTRIVDDIKMSTYSATRAAFGTRNSNSATASKGYSVFQTGANTFRSDYFGSSVTVTLDKTTDQRVTIDRNKNVCTIAGKTATNTAVASGEATYTLMLFTYSNSGSAGSKSSMDRYSTKIYEGDALVHDYIPCETAGGEVGLWDDVDEVFRGNDGTGTFIAGPEVEIEIDPMAPHDGHNTNIENVAYEVESATALFNGVLREIEYGTTIFDGVAREIPFIEAQPSTFTVECSGAGKSYKHYATIDGTSYANALTAGDVVEVEAGTEIYCRATSDQTGQNPIITMNGVDVGSGTTTKTYTFFVTGNVTIKYTTIEITSGLWYKGIVEITME